MDPLTLILGQAALGIAGSAWNMYAGQQQAQVMKDRANKIAELSTNQLNTSYNSQAKGIDLTEDDTIAQTADRGITGLMSTVQASGAKDVSMTHLDAWRKDTIDQIINQKNVATEDAQAHADSAMVNGLFGIGGSIIGGFGDWNKANKYNPQDANADTGMVVGGYAVPANLNLRNNLQ
jgi:hypothetical protein